MWRPSRESRELQPFWAEEDEPWRGERRGGEGRGGQRRGRPLWAGPTLLAAPAVLTAS